MSVCDLQVRVTCDVEPFLSFCQDVLARLWIIENRDAYNRDTVRVVTAL